MCFPHLYWPFCGWSLANQRHDQAVTDTKGRGAGTPRPYRFITKFIKPGSPIDGLVQPRRRWLFTGKEREAETIGQHHALARRSHNASDGLYERPNRMGGKHPAQTWP